MTEERALIQLARQAIVFFAAVPPAHETVEILFEQLDQGEQTKALRFVYAKDASLFITAHALLRYALWRVTDNTFWQFSANEFGKPELSPPFGAPPLRFNLSHSKALAACAVCQGYDIGVDVEAIDDDFQFHEVAKHVFTERERTQLNSCAPDTQRAAFLRMWTLKEALMKGCGCGFSLSPLSLDTNLDPLNFSCDVDSSMTSEHWYVEQRELAPGHWACVALRRPPSAAIAIKWQPVDPAVMTRAAINWASG